jgi:hypothetical protein
MRKSRKLSIIQKEKKAKKKIKKQERMGKKKKSNAFFLLVSSRVFFPPGSEASGKIERKEKRQGREKPTRSKPCRFFSFLNALEEKKQTKLRSCLKVPLEASLLGV